MQRNGLLSSFRHVFRTYSSNCSRTLLKRNLNGYQMIAPRKYYFTCSMPFLKDKAARETSDDETSAASSKAAAADAAEKHPSVEENAYRIDELEKELEEWKAEVQYALAERENLRRILKKEVDDMKHYGMKNFAEDLLEVSDNFERALESVSEEQLKSNEELRKFYEGVAMTEKQFHNVFDKYGVSKFNPSGEKFDPNFHMAVMEDHDSDLDAGHVSVVIKKGFHIKDKVLRPAQVGVSKGAKKKE